MPWKSTGLTRGTPLLFKVTSEITSTSLSTATSTASEEEEVSYVTDLLQGVSFIAYPKVLQVDIENMPKAIATNVDNLGKIQEDFLLISS